jgi:nicotinamide-nucleotide amidase
MNGRIEIVTIGDEVLRGETQENNGVWLSRALIHAGLDPWRITALADDMDVLVAEFRDAAARSDTVVVTGGLGPTVDDITKEALIRALEAKTEFHEEIVDAIAEQLKQRGRAMIEGYNDQGRVPVGCDVIENPLGLAVGLRVRAAKIEGEGGAPGSAGRSCEFFLLPGVPAEMHAMFSASVLPALGAPGIDSHIRIRTFGLIETEVEDALRRTMPPDVLETIAIISSPKGVDFYVPREPAGVRHAANAARELGSYVYAEGNERLEGMVVGLLVARRMTAATAESVTGGLIASTLISVPGASDAFREGFVTYSNESKMERLGVERETLEDHGAVSEETCREMAEGARAAASVDFALSTTGIAGPTGAVPGKPVGLCCIGLAGPDGTYVRRFEFIGGRETVRVRAAYNAIDMLRLALVGETGRLEPFRAAGARGGEKKGRTR